MTTKSNKVAKGISKILGTEALTVIAARWVQLELASDSAYGAAMAEFRMFYGGCPVGDQAAYDARQIEVKTVSDKALEAVTPEQRKAYVKRRRVYQNRIRNALKVKASTPQVGGRQKVEGTKTPASALTACDAALATLAAHFPDLSATDKVAVREKAAKIMA